MVSDKMSELRKLNPEEIEKILKTFPNAKHIAVENFLMTVAACQKKYYTIENLKKDKFLYGWNSDTFKAILKGIETAVIK